MLEDEVTIEELEAGFEELHSPEVINENDDEYFIRIGYTDFYFYKDIMISEWLYYTPVAELKPEDFFRCSDVNDRLVFILKIGIEKLLEFGTVIDSYVNYPDNEMWAKSEYKLIDMSKLCLRDVYWGNHKGVVPIPTYTPYLYMKNQTTGVYHLEGIHLRCKTLYDAIKMRYNGLNIKDFEIEDIK